MTPFALDEKIPAMLFYDHTNHPTVTIRLVGADGERLLPCTKPGSTDVDAAFAAFVDLVQRYVPEADMHLFRAVPKLTRRSGQPLAKSPTQYHVGFTLDGKPTNGLGVHDVPICAFVAAAYDALVKLVERGLLHLESNELYPVLA